MVRMKYEEALKLRPRGACYCDLDDRACYERGHWQPSERFHQREASGFVTAVALTLFIGAIVVGLAVLR